MDLWKENRWFAVHTKAQREAFAAANVTTLGVAMLLPRLKVEHLVRGDPAHDDQNAIPWLFLCPLLSGKIIGIRCNRTGSLASGQLGALSHPGRGRGGR